MKTLKVLAVLTVVFMIAAFAGTAQATPITGGFSIGGTAVGVDNTGAATGLNVATGLDFTTGAGVPTPNVAGSISVVNRSGKYAIGTNLPVGSTGSISDFTFAGAL